MNKKDKIESIRKELEKIQLLNEYTYHHSSLTEEDEEMDDQDSETTEVEDIEIPNDEPDSEITDIPNSNTDEPTIEDVPEDNPIEQPLDNVDDSSVEEVDITDLKNDIDLIKQSIENNDKFIGTMSQALDKLDFIQNKLGQIDQITTKIESLENEIEERNPTPVEKLELSSLTSFPYNTKLSNYFDDLNNDIHYQVEPNQITPQNSPNEISNEVPSETEQTYELSDEDIKNGYNENEIKRSF